MNKLTLWIARDKTGNLYLYSKKPERTYPTGYFVSRGGEYMRIDNNKFPDLKWEDEPMEITIEL